MIKPHKTVFLLVIATFISAMILTSCEINRAGEGWQKLPDLSKPREAPNVDKGGEFRKILMDLWEIKLEEDEPIKAVITFWDLAYFAGGLSAKVVQTSVVAPDPTDLYRFEPDPETVLPALKDAHIVFKVGLGLDDWIDPLIEEAKTENPKLVTIDLTRNIELIGNQWNPDPYHPAKIENYNPWFWLNPDNVMALADTFYQVFITLKPLKDEEMREGSGILQNNVGIFPSTQLQLEAFDDKILIQDVPVWSYFAQYFDLTITATLMPDGVTQPSEQELESLAEKAKEDGVVAILKTHEYGSGIADKFSEISGIPTIEVYPHPRMADKGMDDYFQQEMGNTNILLKAFREMGLTEHEIKMPEQEEPSAPPGMDVEIPEETRKQLEEMAKQKAEEESSENTEEESSE